MSWIVELCSMCREEMKNWHELTGHVQNCGHKGFETVETKEMTDDLNKQWAELEGWEPSWNQLSPPNYTKPNRFFAEVVPRMRELGFTFLLSDQEEDNQFEFFYLNKRSGWNNIIIHNKVGIAGLTAAIQARKEIGK